MTTSLNKWIYTVSDFIALIQFHLICQILTKFSGVESERTVSKFRKRKGKVLCSPTPQSKSVKLGNFMSQSYKKAWWACSCCFANLHLLLFCCSRYYRRRHCLSSLLVWSRNFATTVTWRHTFLLYSKADLGWFTMERFHHVLNEWKTAHGMWA